MCVCVYEWIDNKTLLMLADVLVRGQAAESMGRKSDLGGMSCHHIALFSPEHEPGSALMRLDETIGGRAPSRKVSILQ
jgi:hypothetical protein